MKLSNATGYMFAKNYQNIPSGLKVITIFYNIFRTERHALARVFLKKPGILKVHWLDLVGM